MPLFTLASLPSARVPPDLLTFQKLIASFPKGALVLRLASVLTGQCLTMLPLKYLHILQLKN